MPGLSADLNLFALNWSKQGISLKSCRLVVAVVMRQHKRTQARIFEQVLYLFVCLTWRVYLGYSPAAS